MKKIIIIASIIPASLLLGLGAAAAAIETSRFIYWIKR